nr:unnamed protein product [Digitaria exilis]
MDHQAAGRLFVLLLVTTSPVVAAVGVRQPTSGLRRGGSPAYLRPAASRASSPPWGADRPQMDQLILLDVSHNAIYGGVPAEVAIFNVSYNRLCAKVPTGGNMARFDTYSC